VVQLSANGIHAFPSNKLCTHGTIMTVAALQWQYLQMELILLIHLVYLQPKQ
jgi:hypothetical protein